MTDTQKALETGVHWDMERPSVRSTLIANLASPSDSTSRARRSRQAGLRRCGVRGLKS